MWSMPRKRSPTTRKRSWKKAKRKEISPMATRTVDFILDNTCGRIAHTIRRTEAILTTRTLEEDSKEEAKEEDSKEEDSKEEDSKDVDSKQSGLTKIRVAASQEEAEETTSTSKDT